MMTHLRVRELAEQRGLNITTLARKAALAYNTAWGLWHDKLTQLDRKVLDRTALALDVRVGDLFGGEPSDEGEAQP